MEKYNNFLHLMDIPKTSWSNMNIFNRHWVLNNYPISNISVYNINNDMIYIWMNRHIQKMKFIKLIIENEMQIEKSFVVWIFIPIVHITIQTSTYFVNAYTICMVCVYLIEFEIYVLMCAGWFLWFICYCRSWQLLQWVLPNGFYTYIFPYIHSYLCMFICLNVYMHMYMCVCMYVSLYTYASIYMQVYMHVFVFVYVIYKYVNKFINKIHIYI